MFATSGYLVQKIARSGVAKAWIMRRRLQNRPRISKPIIILGTGRCGSTVFHRLLARHPRTMWLSGLSDRYPTRTDWNRRAVSLMHQPLLRRLFGGKVQPSEAYLFLGLPRVRLLCALS